MSEDEAIKRLQEILDFKKNTIDKIEDPIEREIEENCYIEEMPFKAIETILDLYKNTKYELKGQEALVDTMSHNEEVLTRAYEILEKKLQQEREKNKELDNENKKLSEEIIENICKGAEEDVLEEYRQQVKNSISKDKIREKIKELEEKSDYWNYDEIQVLKELLEEE